MKLRNEAANTRKQCALQLIAIKIIKTQKGAQSTLPRSPAAMNTPHRPWVCLAACAATVTYGRGGSGDGDDIHLSVSRFFFVCSCDGSAQPLEIRAGGRVPATVISSCAPPHCDYAFIFA